MRIGVLKESAPRERRVALTPDAARRLIKAGSKIVIERGAGEASSFPDALYEDAGCALGDAAAAESAEMIVAVQAPDRARSARLAESAVLVALIAPGGLDSLDVLVGRRVTVLALERIPRITRAQSMDVLSSQATVAGYQAVLMGASTLPRFLPMLTTAAGSIAPAKALILGAGVAGLQAIATARRLGAVVTGFDVRPAAAEQVASLGARFLAPEAVGTDAETSGGYARELADAAQQKVLEAVARAIDAMDLVIATAAIPGRPAPRLITRAMVESMRPGSVIVDVSAETGGNCELTVPGETVRHADISIVGPLNLPSAMPQHASQMFGRNVQTLLDHLAPKGELTLDLDDEITSAMCLAHAGARRQERGT